MSQVYEKSYTRPKYVYSTYQDVLLSGSYRHNVYQDAWLDTGGSLTGSTNPQWRDQVRRHTQAGTNMVATRTTKHHGHYSIMEKFNWVSSNPNPGWTDVRHGWGNRYITNPYAVFNTTLLESKANNRALTSYIRNANRARRVLNGGELVGEFAELVRQVSSPGKSLRKGYDSYLRTVKKRAARKRLRRVPAHRRSDIQTRIIKDTWLEYSFGWRPLVSEIKNVVDYVREKDTAQRLDTREVRGVGEEEDAAWDFQTVTPLTVGPPTIHGRSRTFAKVTVVYRGQVGMSSNAGGYILEKQGLAPADWVPTAWELVPYSFLADYFANVGDIIAAHSFPTNQLRFTMKTVITEVTGKFVDLRGGSWYVPQSFSGSGYTCNVGRHLLSLGGASHMVRTVDRKVYTDTLVPSYEFSIPNSGTQWLNMAALFAGSRYVEKLIRLK